MYADRVLLDQFTNKAPTFQECHTSNMSIPKAMFHELGEFDESLWAFEDLDFAYRAQKAGCKLIFSKEAVGYHNHPMSLDEACAQQESYQKYAAIFLNKHPELEGEITYLSDKYPVDWREDSPKLIAKKLLRKISATPPVLKATTPAARFAETKPLSPTSIRKIYWLVLGAYQYRGFRRGLRSTVSLS
jgi:GT2 family glycosyltransferase